MSRVPALVHWVIGPLGINTSEIVEQAITVTSPGPGLIVLAIQQGGESWTFPLTPEAAEFLAGRLEDEIGPADQGATRRGSSCEQTEQR